MEKLHALTGLRFAAAAMIVLHHSRGVLGLERDFLGGVPLHYGVSFFFVLSGFILTHVYPRLPDARAVRAFFVARVARIWPAHLFAFCLVLVLGLPGVPGHANPATTAAIATANAALLHAWAPISASFFSFNAVSWTISTELGFYAAFPLLIAGFERTWRWKLALALALAAALIVACEIFAVPGAASASPFQVNRAGFLYVHPLARLAEFVLGMATALAWRRAGWRGRLPAFAATVLECFCVAACAGAIVALASREALRAQLPDALAAYLHHCAAAPAFALLIFVFATGCGWLARFFATRVLVLLGEISFSIYLLHQIFLRALLPWKAQLLGAGFGEGALYATYWTALLAASWAVWRWIERPFRYQLLRLAPARAT